MACRKNERQERIKGLQKGRCWKCVRCENNAVVVDNRCNPCNRSAKPNPSHRSCIILPRQMLGIKTNWQAKFIIALTIVGIVSVFFIAFVFIKYRNTKVIKASGRELCAFILLGILFSFLNSVIFILPPGKVNCSLRQMFPGFAFFLCYGPLFLKLNRIYRIFVNSERFETIYMASTKSQVLLVLGVTAFQLLPGCIWTINRVPDIVTEYPNHRNYVVLHCPIDQPGFFINLILGVIFMLLSTWYAFKTRSFPRNFNESKYIGISLYIICIFWALFIPAMLFAKPDDEFVHEYMICAICTLVGYAILAGLFVPKVKRVLCSSTEHPST